MAPTAPDSAPLERAMRNTRRSVLGVLATCALLIFVHGFGGDEPPPDRLVATAAIVLALGAIVMRRVSTSPVIRPKTSIFLRLGALMTCAALGGLGVYLAYGLATPLSGILFTLAGIVFALRPTPILRTR
jgi:hypothetical protein